MESYSLYQYRCGVCGKEWKESDFPDDEDAKNGNYCPGCNATDVSGWEVGEQE